MGSAHSRLWICWLGGVAMLGMGPVVAPACEPNGVYSPAPAISYSCATGAVDLDVTEFRFSIGGSSITARSTQPEAPLLGTVTSCPSGSFDNTATFPGACDVIYNLQGQFAGDDSWDGVFSVEFTGSTCFDCVNQQWTVAGTRLSLFVDDFETADTSGWSAVEDGRWHPPPGTSWQWQFRRHRHLYRCRDVRHRPLRCPGSDHLEISLPQGGR